MFSGKRGWIIAIVFFSLISISYALPQHSYNDSKCEKHLWEEGSYIGSGHDSNSIPLSELLNQTDDYGNKMFENYTLINGDNYVYLVPGYNSDYIFHDKGNIYTKVFVIVEKYNSTHVNYLGISQEFSNSSDCNYQPYKNIYRLFVVDDNVVRNIYNPGYNNSNYLDFCGISKSFEAGIKSFFSPSDATEGIFCLQGSDFIPLYQINISNTTNNKDYIAQNYADEKCKNESYSYGMISRKLEYLSPVVYGITCLNNTGDFVEYSQEFSGTFDQINYQVYKFCLGKSANAVTGYVNEWDLDTDKSSKVVCINDPSIGGCTGNDNCSDLDCDSDESPVCLISGGCVCREDEDDDCDEVSDCPSCSDSTCTKVCENNVCKCRDCSQAYRCSSHTDCFMRGYGCVNGECVLLGLIGGGDGGSMLGGADNTTNNIVIDRTPPPLATEPAPAPRSTNPISTIEESPQWLFIFWVVLFSLIFLIATGTGIYYWRKYELEGHEMIEVYGKPGEEENQEEGVIEEKTAEEGTEKKEKKGNSKTKKEKEYVGSDF